MMAPFTRSGARPRAQAQLQQRVADPAAAARQLDGESLGGLTPAQRVGDDNLLALERTLMETNPESAARYRAQMARSEEMLRRAAEELGDSAGLEQRIAQATERAQRRIATLAPDAGPERASEIYHNELMASLRAAKARESALWDVPNVRISTATSRMRFAELEGALSRAQADDMPAVARKLLGHPPKGADEPALLVGPRGETLATSRGALGDTEPVKELHGLYSALREESRAARSVGNYNRARLSDDLAEAVWTDLTGAADAPTTVGAQLAAAREYSRELNQAFRQGDVGRILGYARSGERRVQPTEALEAAMGGRGGAQAAVTVDELRHAAEFGGGDVQAAEGAMQDYLKRRFLLAAHADPDGGFSAPGAERFLKANEQLLGRFPGLQQQLTAAGAEMQSAAALNRSREAAAAAFRSQTPRDTLKRSLHGMTAEDRTAMRGAMIEQALSPSRTPDATGQVPVSGERIQGLLANARTRGAFAEVFSPEELTRLTRIADELAKVQKAQGRLDPTIPGGEVLDPPGMSRVVKTANFLAGTIGARLGSKFGQGTSGASLRTASRGARMAEGEMLGYLNRHATKLVMDATNDPSLYRALMTPMNATGSGGESARSVLSRWVARTQAELGDAGRQVTIPPGVGVMGEQLAAGQEPRMSRTGAQ